MANKRKKSLSKAESVRRQAQSKAALLSKHCTNMGIYYNISRHLISQGAGTKTAEKIAGKFTGCNV